MSLLVVVFRLWFISCVHSDKKIKEKCEKDTLHQVFEHETKCSQENTFLNTLPEFIKLHPNYLPYILYPNAMEHFKVTVRTLSASTLKQQQDIVGATEVQYHLATTDGGKTLVIMFPGTTLDLGKVKFWDQPDIKIDVSTKHRKVQLPRIIDERFRYNRPDLDNWEQSGKLTPEQLTRREINTFRVHEGIYDRMHDREIQTALQKDLAYLYSGHYEKAPIPWMHFVADSRMKELEPLFIKYGFQQLETHDSTASITARYTNPEATHLLSSQWINFISDESVTKEDIVLVTEQIRDLQKKFKVLKGARVHTGVRTTKVENLIISGHSLGGGYAVLFYLLLYGHPSMLQAEGFNVLPQSFKQVTVVPFAAPSVVYHEDIRRINPGILSRVTNIWNYDDPVPLLLNGARMKVKEGVSWSTTHKYLTDDALIAFGTNQPIGNVMIMFKDKQRIRDGESYEESEDDNVWFKLVPWKQVNLWGSDLMDNIYYVNYGATCLWKTTFGGVLGAIPGATQHPYSRYMARIYESCLWGYLQKHSDYFRKQAPKLEEVFKLKKRKRKTWKELFIGRSHSSDSDSDSADSARSLYGENEYNQIKQYTNHDDIYTLNNDSYDGVPLILCLYVAGLLMICMCLFPLGIWWGYVVLPRVEWSKYKRYLVFVW